MDTRDDDRLATFPIEMDAEYSPDRSRCRLSFLVQPRDKMRYS